MSLGGVTEPSPGLLQVRGKPSWSKTHSGTIFLCFGDGYAPRDDKIHFSSKGSLTACELFFVVSGLTTAICQRQRAIKVLATFIFPSLGCRFGHNTAACPGVAFTHTHEAGELLELLDLALLHPFPGRGKELSPSL